MISFRRKNVKINYDSKNKEPKHRVNDEIIGYDKVRIIGDDIESKVVSLKEARDIAESMELDLIEINANGEIPIIRIGSYEKFLYNQKKAEKVKKQNQTKSQMKEIHLTVSIASNDLKTKASKAKGFLEDGNKVKVILFMKGRELARREENKRSIYEFIELLNDVSVPESMPKDDGDKSIVILKKKR